MLFINTTTVSRTPIVNNATEAKKLTGGIVTNEVAAYLQYLFYSVLCQAIVVFGISANGINIACFVKQGFNDPVNISLLGLAVSDIGCLSTLIWINICFTPAFIAADFPFDSVEIQYLTSGIPHTAFSRITGCITAFITLERCLCITAPLKIKGIITPRKVSYITVAIFVISICSITPEYVVNKIGPKYFPQRNRTIIGLVYASNRESVSEVSYLVNNAMVPFVSFSIIIVCTILLVIQLHISTKWRKISTATAQVDNVLYRNQKISKVVVMISTLFIICFVPLCLLFIAMSQVKEFSMGGKYKNVLLVLTGFGVVLEAINSSVNIFIYYYMSTKYRLVFREILKGCYK